MAAYLVRPLSGRAAVLNAMTDDEGRASVSRICADMCILVHGDNGISINLPI